MIKPFNNSIEQELVREQLLTEPERHKLLVEWNNTQSDYPNDKCIYELFESVVEQLQEAVAPTAFS